MTNEPTDAAVRAVNKSNQNPHGLVVGQTLCWARTDMLTGIPRSIDVRVVSIGRDYARLDYGSMRVDLRTLRVSGRESLGYSYGSCHLSREIWEQAQNLERTWNRFRRAVDARRQPPDGLTLEMLVQAQTLLDI